MTHERDLEYDLRALAGRAGRDDAFADELYCALCNADWVSRWWDRVDRQLAVCGRRRCGSAWEGRGLPRLLLLAERRRGDDLERVGAVMAGLGWHATAHGAPLRLIDFATGTSMVFVDGDWVDAGDYDG